jgi:hypothetical protein
MANTSEQPPKYDMNDQEQAMLARARQEQASPPEMKTPELQMAEEFDLGTKKLNARAETYRTRIADANRLMAENQKKGGLNLAANLGVENAIAQFNKDLQPIEEELKKRGPSPEEINIQKQMQNTEDAKKLRVAEGQQGQEDIDPNYEAQMDGLKKGLETAKLARIQKFQAAEAGGVPEKPEEEAAQAEAPAKAEQPEGVFAPEGGETEKLAKRREMGKLLEEMRAREAKGENLMDYRNGEGLGYGVKYSQLFEEITGKRLGVEAEAATAAELDADEKVILGGNFGTAEAQARMGEMRQQKIAEAYMSGGKLSDLAVHKQMLEKKGIIIADVPLMQLAKQGYKVEPAGILDRFMGRTVKVTGPDGKPSTLSRIGFQQLQTEKIKQFGEELKQELQGQAQAERNKIKEKNVRRLIEGAVGSLPAEAPEPAEAAAVAPAPEVAVESAAAPEATDSAAEAVQEAAGEAPAEVEAPSAPEAAEEPEEAEAEPAIDEEGLRAQEAKIEKNSEKETKKLMKELSNAIAASIPKTFMTNKEWKGYADYIKRRVLDGGQVEKPYQGVEEIGAFRGMVKAFAKEYRDIVLRKIDAKIKLYGSFRKPAENVVPIAGAERPAEAA